MYTIQVYLIHATSNHTNVLSIADENLRIQKDRGGIMGAETVYFADDIAKSSQYAVSQGNTDTVWLQRVFGGKNAEELQNKKLCFVFLFRVTLGKGFFLNGHHFSGLDFEEFGGVPSWVLESFGDMSWHAFCNEQLRILYFVLDISCRCNSGRHSTHCFALSASRVRLARLHVSCGGRETRRRCRDVPLALPPSTAYQLLTN